LSSGPDRIEIVWSEEDAAYVATVPQFDGCSALGATPALALEEVLVVAALWAEADREDGASDSNGHAGAIPAPELRSGADADLLAARERDASLSAPQRPQRPQHPQH
jgi:predicted RNase H-like HicB family nuclease